MVQFLDENPPVVSAAPVADRVQLQRAPWHIRAVGLAALAWNAIGALQYILAQLRHPAYFDASARAMGVTREQLIAYLDAFPVWLHGFWALGVWGAVAGSILLLARRRWAIAAFAVSLLGLAVTQFAQAFTPPPPWASGDLALNLALWSIASFLLIYAVSMRRKGVLP